MNKNFLINALHFNKSVKKLISTVTLLCLIAMSVQVGVAADNYIGSTAEAVHICKVINMLKGTSSDGLTEEYLQSTPMRYQGATMLLRLKGLENQALNMANSNNFKDVNDFKWQQGRNILGYLYSNQQTIGFRGYQDQTFRPYLPITAKQYYKVMLVALGYIEDVDFTWNGTATLPSVENLAARLGMSKALSADIFTVEQLALATVEALRAELKQGGTSLADQLVDQNLIEPLFAQNAKLSLKSTGDNNTTGSDSNNNNDKNTDKDNDKSTNKDNDKSTNKDNNKDNNQSVPLQQIGVDLSVTGNYELDNAYGDGAYITLKLSGGEFVDDLETNPLLAKQMIKNIQASGDIDWEKQYTGREKDIKRVNANTLRVKLSYNYISEDKTLSIIIPAAIIKDYEKDLNAGTIKLYDTGNGSAKQPYLIFNARHFNYLSQLPSNAHIVLLNDIDMADYPNFLGMAVYSGVLDGKGHTVSNLTINTSLSVSYMGQTRRTCLGLFGYMVNNSKIANITFDKATIAHEGFDTHFTGVIAGYMESSVIDNVNITNSHIASQYNDTNTFSYTGALVGQCSKSQIIDVSVHNCTISNRSTKGKMMVGGLCGIITSDATIENSGVLKSEVSLNKTLEKTAGYLPKAGGIAGSSIDNVLIDNCSFEGHIKGNGAVGGIVGYKHNNALMISGCTVEGILENYSTHVDNNGSSSATGGIIGAVTSNKCTVIACKSLVNRYIIHHRLPSAVHRIVAIPGNRSQLTLNHNSASVGNAIYLVNIDYQSQDMEAWVKVPLSGNEDQDAEIIATELFNDRSKTGLDGADQ